MSSGSRVKVRRHHGRWAACCVPCLWTEVAPSWWDAMELAGDHVHRTVLGPARIAEGVAVQAATSTAVTSVKDARPDAWGWQGLSVSRPPEVW